MAHTCAVSFVSTSAIGSGQCVELVKSACKIGTRTGDWQAGEKVVGNTVIQPGTAIATFVHGVYPSHGHAAIYLGQDGKSIRVKQQYTQGLHPFVIHEADIKIGAKGHLPGDDANNYYIIK